MVDDSRVTKLSQFTFDSEKAIGTGTEFEMRTQADALAQEWSEKDGFKAHPDDHLVFEPLKNIIALAAIMGFAFVYSKKNFPATVPLSKWPGMAPKNGGGYEYALDLMRIHARPTPPPHSLGAQPEDPKDDPAFFAKYVALLKTVGESDEFILGGDRF
jgi:hypothetical protein